MPSAPRKPKKIILLGIKFIVLIGANQKLSED
jgi:hypothetical protein